MKSSREKGKENRPPHVFRKDCSEEGEIFIVESVLHDDIITIEFNLGNEIANAAELELSATSAFGTFSPNTKGAATVDFNKLRWLFI